MTGIPLFAPRMAAYMLSLMFVAFSVASPLAKAQTVPKFEDSEAIDLVFSFITPISDDDDLSHLSEEANNAPSIEEGDLFTGEDILKRLEARGAKEQENLLLDHSFSALLEHPKSGKTIELHIAHCKTLNYDSVEGPFAQQVLCGKDLYSYQAGREGLEILLNGEVYLDIPLDPGSYRINGAEVAIR